MIIHSPVISGSLTFAEGATFTLPDNGIYSGSFSGSFQGDGSSLTFGGTNIVSSSEQLSLEFLDTLGDGVVSGSSQIEFNDINNNPFTQGASSVTVSKSIVPNSLTLDLGSLSNPFRDLYLSSASLFVDGTQVISSNTNELIITTDANQSLKLVETGADTVQIQTENGDITLTSSGTGNIELDAPIQIVAGNQILSSDGNAIQFGEDIDVDGDLNVQGNITLTGTVDTVDIAQLRIDVDGILDGAAADKNSFAEIVSLINSVDTTNDEAFASHYTSSNQRLDSLEGFTSSIDTTIKTKLNADAVVSSSAQISFNSVDSNPFQGGSSNDITASGHLVPSQHETYDLGSPVLRWRDLYLSGSTIDLGGTLITRDASGDVELLDSTTRTLKKVIVEELQIGSGDNARKIKIDESGSIQFADKNDVTKTDAISSVASLGLGLPLPGDGVDTLGTRVSNLEGTDIVITLSGDVSGTGTINNLSDVSITTTIADDSHNHTISNVDGLQTALDGKQAVGSYVTTDSAQALSSAGDALTFATNVLTLTRGDGSTDTVDLSAFLDDTNLVTSVAGKQGVVTLDTGDVSEGSNLYYTDNRVKAVLDSETVISSSAQITITESQISDLAHYTDSDVKLKLNADEVVSGSADEVRSFLNVQNGATDDQTGAEIKSALFGESDTNNLTDALLSKLNGIEASADVTDTDNVVAALTAGTNITIAADGTISSTDTDTQLSNEQVQDIVGGMLTGNTETGITVTYQDEDGTLDFVVASQTDENFTTTLKNKLDGIESGATGDQSASEIKSLYEGNSNTNAFTDALLSKLNGIEAGATADQTSEEIQDIVGGMVSSNTESGIAVTYDDTNGKLNFSVSSQTDENFTTTLKNKLDGIESGANVTDAANVDAAGAVMNSDTSTAAMSFVIDEDNMASNSATKVPTQQSVKTYVDNEIDILIGGAPGALDTLNELAAAINDDSSYASTITTQLGTKANSSVTITAGNGLTGGGNLTTNRELAMSGTYSGTFAVTGNITATGDVIAYASSDRRLKDNIVNIENPIEKVQKLNGVTWDWNDNADELQKSTPTVGVIAQEVEEVLPQLVNTRDNGYKAVDYAKLTGLLIEAIKDQQKQIDELKSRLQ
jgi:hypothetical protein